MRFAVALTFLITGFLCFVIGIVVYLTVYREAVAYRNSFFGTTCHVTGFST